MHSHPCLNCDQELQGNYCANCGQKASTHRLSMKHFLVHDLVHGIWHLDKGVPFTLRKTIAGPGKVAKDYISGKRVGHFNLITLALLLLGISLYLQHTLKHGHMFLEIEDGHMQVKQYDAAIGIKLIAFSFIPLFALVAALYFRRLRYNYTEHVVAATFTLLGVLVIYILTKGLDYTLTAGFFERYYVDWICFGLFIGLSYYQLVSGRYSVAGFGWRIALTQASFVLLWLFIFTVLYIAFGLRAFGFRYIPSPEVH